jgi:hypothetical protein
VTLAKSERNCRYCSRHPASTIICPKAGDTQRSHTAENLLHVRRWASQCVLQTGRPRQR